MGDSFNPRIVTLLSQKVDPGLILEAFFNGADGVLFGCSDEGRIQSIRWLLGLVGIDRRRFCIVPGAEGDLARLVADFANDIKDLGQYVLKVPNKDLDVLQRMLRWMEALNAVPAGTGGETIPLAKNTVFSQAFRLAKPYKSEIPEAQSYIMADPTVCVGCRTCEAVCSQAHEGVVNPSLARIQIAYDAFRRYPNVYCKQDVCKQCTGADCVAACPNGALLIDADTGARYINASLCTGCRSCQEACQWGMITYVPERNICIKCDLCGGDPECVKVCPAAALKYVVTKGGSELVRMAG